VAELIDSQRAQYQIPVAVSCRALGVSPAWFYKWRGGDASVRRARRRGLGELIAALFLKHRGTYGAPRITADLRTLDWRVSENTVATIMAERGLVARPKRRRKGTTRAGKAWRAPDLVRRKFHASQLNERWFGDGTDLGTDEGTLYLASILDICSRRIVGFSVSEHHDTALAYGALTMAIAVRGGDVRKVVLHTDSEYVGAGVPGLPDPHSDGRDRMLVPGGSRAS
jgi:putative transposase